MVRDPLSSGQIAVGVLWTTAARIREELAEAEENYLAGRQSRGIAAVRKASSKVVEIAAIELGLGHLEDMMLILAGQVTE